MVMGDPSLSNISSDEYEESEKNNWKEECDVHFNEEDVRANDWQLCELVPAKFISGKVETKKIVFRGYEYNYHESSKSNIFYR